MPRRRKDAHAATAANSDTSTPIVERDRFFADVAPALRVPPFVSAEEWCANNIRIPLETESPGRFDLELFPHVRGVLRAANNLDVRRVLLRWAARNAKTLTSFAITIYRRVTTFLPMSMVGADKDNTRDGREAFYEMLIASGFEDDLLPEHKRSEREIRIGGRRIRVRSAGSKAGLSGYPSCYGHGFEFAKWPQWKSSEASAANRYKKRFIGFPFNSQVTFEGTPAKLGECELTREIEKPSVRRLYFQVPCPHCGTFQRLQFSPKYGTHPTAGLQWDKKPGGHEDAQLASVSAWYRCVGGCRIESAERPKMLRAGQWVAEGQSIDNHGVITGDGVISDEWAFDELSQLYSPLIAGWGSIAKEWVNVEQSKDPKTLQSFVNEVLARAYDPAPPKRSYHGLAARFRSETPLGKVPSWARFLVWASDVGSKQVWRDDEHGLVDVTLFWWMVVAFGPKVRTHVVDFNLATGEDALRRTLAAWGYERLNSDQRKPNTKQLCRPAIGGIDCGYRVKARGRGEVDAAGTLTYHLYNVCDQLTAADSTMPCVSLHGITTAIPELYKWDYRVAGELPSEVSRKRKHQEGDLLGVNTHVTQTWIDASIRGLVGDDDPGRITLPAEVCNTTEHPQHLDFLSQLGAEYFDGAGWTSAGRHEWRDDLRYARTLAELVIAQRGGDWDNPPDLLFPSTVGNTADDDEDGHDWIQTRRTWGRP